MVEKHDKFHLWNYEFNWLRDVLQERRNINKEGGKRKLDLDRIKGPEQDEDFYFHKLLQKHKFANEERLALLLALVPFVYPGLLDVFKSDNIPSSFGGVIGENRAFIPTGETLLFILADNDITMRLEHLEFFDHKQNLISESLLYLDKTGIGEPELGGILRPSKELIDLVLYGRVRKPDLSLDFPAKLLTTKMEWDDLVIPNHSREQMNEIESWIQFSKELSSDRHLGKKIKSGYRALFYGPPGTGKTLAATLIGKKTGRDVYRIDLSTVVSKYIGETEKNLKRLFDRAERKDWILFFDEADALFGKRTGVSNSNDRYANQEVSYLLQRVEYFDGMVILATNMKNNIDKAFIRRFQNIIHFPVPKAEERLQLWKNTFPDRIPLDESVDLSRLAEDYELTGAHIVNIISYCTLKVMSNDKTTIDNPLLRKGIARELVKEGKTL